MPLIVALWGFFSANSQIDDYKLISEYEAMREGESLDERLRKELLRYELKERNKGKKIIRCKYRPKYPDSAERECICVNRKGSRMATLRIDYGSKKNTCSKKLIVS